jgi:uncharacterized SAM-binding protein YcdF (DUF218 family)
VAASKADQRADKAPENQASPAMKKKNIHPLYLLAAVGLAAVGGAWLFREPILLAMGDYLVVQDELQPADVIHVIAGEDYRTEHAIALYQQGYARVIFFTGGWCETYQYYHGQHGAQLALAAGVPQEAIAFDDAVVTSTYSEAERLKAWIGQSEEPVTSVMVVSDPFHMRRAQWVYRRVLGEGVDVLMAPVPFEETIYRRAWWTNSDSQRYISNEYLKLIYYPLRYQLSWGWIKDWLASAVY